MINMQDNNFYKKVFSRNLNRYMIKSQKNQNDLVRDLKLDKSTVSTWCNGTRIPRMNKIELLANYFNINKSDLIEEKNNNIEEIKPVKIPVLGRISAGLPLYAEQQLEGYMLAPENIIKEGYEYFYLRVNGDSMNQKFNDGDLVLVQKQDTLENGEIGVIRVNGYDATIKRFKQEGNLVVLEPMSTNPIHTTQIYNPEKIDIKIIGKAIWKTGRI